MNLPRTAAQVLTDHVVFEIEGIDRMYLNVYVPRLQRAPEVAAGYLMRHRGFPIASSALVAEMSRVFISGLLGYAKTHQVPVLHFKKGQRKDDVMAEHLAEFSGTDEVVFVGIAREKAHVFQTEKRRKMSRLKLLGRPVMRA